MRSNIVKKVRRRVAGEVLKNKRRKIDSKYYGLLPNEARIIRLVERRRKKKLGIKYEFVRKERGIKEHKIPVLEKELQRLVDYKQLLIVFSKRKLSGISAETIMSELQLTNSEIKDMQEKLGKVKLLVNRERKEAEKTAEKIGGKK